MDPARVTIRVESRRRGPCECCGAPGRHRSVDVRVGEDLQTRADRILCIKCARRIGANERWAHSLGDFTTGDKGGVGEPLLTTELPTDAICNRGTTSRWYGGCAPRSRSART